MENMPISINQVHKEKIIFLLFSPVIFLVTTLSIMIRPEHLGGDYGN
jgi:hypothetical protein